MRFWQTIGSGSLGVVLIGLVGSAALIADEGRSAPPSIRMVLTGQLAPVLDWEGSRCDAADVPDASVRGFRRFDGSLVVYAPEFHNHFWVGRDFSHLRKDCREAYHSHQDADPSHFEDETWIASTWTDDGRNVMAIGHHEYRAERHGRCVGTHGQCRYGALLHLVSHDGGASFHKSTSTPIAAVPARQSEDQSKDTGFSQPSNIFEHDGWKYAFVMASGGGAQPHATCLMRARNPLDPASWTIFDGTSFRPALFDPYRDDPAKRPICAQIPQLVNTIVWSVVTHRPTGLLLAILVILEPQTKSFRLATSTSRDAITWSKPLFVDGVDIQWGQACPKPPYLHYPSLVDPASQRRNFDDTGDVATLFFVRIAFENCRMTMQRDLVSAPVRLEVAR